MIGRVTKITPSLYGFITNEDGIQYFFHGSCFKGDWDDLKNTSPPVVKLGPTVQFKPLDTIKGPRAEDVELLGL